MKLFWKHIFRSQKSHPLQPLLILFTVICSVAVAVSAIRFTLFFHNHTYETAQKDLELGDLLITPRGDSNLRLTFPEDAEAVVGKDGKVLGEFRLSGFLKEAQVQTLFGLSCVDLQAADDFYQFTYVQYGRFTQENINTSAVLSQSAAQKHGLAVGDHFTVSLLGEEFTYTVQAIAEDSGLLAHSDALVSIDGMRAALSARVPAIASLGDAFAPYTRLLIRVNEGKSLADILQRLQDAPAFERMSVRTTYNAQHVFFITTVQSLSVWLPCILLLLLTALLLVTCLGALQRKRSGEHALFRTCGATKKQLSLLLCLECAVYAILGTGIGLLIARPLLRSLGGLYDWGKEPLDLNFGAALFGILWAGVLMGGCILWHLRSQEELSLTQALQEVSAEEDKKPSPKLLIPALVLQALSLLCLLLVPMQWHYIPAIGALFALIWIAYLLLPQLFRVAATHLVRLTERKARPRPIPLLAWKNFQHIPSLRRTGSLLCMLLASLLTLSTCIDVAQDQIDEINESVLVEYVAVGADRATAQKVEQMEQVEDVLFFTYHSSIKLDGEYAAFGISTEDDHQGFLQIQHLPKERAVGNELALSIGVAQLLGKGVGDTVTVEIEGVSRSLVITELLRTNTHLATYDITYFGFSHQMLLIKTALGADQTEDALEATTQQITSMLEQNGSVLLSKELVYGTMPIAFYAHTTLLKYAISVAILLTLVGSSMVLAQQFRARKNERHLLHISGMRKREILALQVWELALMLLLAVLFGSILAYLLCTIVDAGIASFGLNLFL